MNLQQPKHARKNKRLSQSEQVATFTISTCCLQSLANWHRPDTIGYVDVLCIVHGTNVIKYVQIITRYYKHKSLGCSRARELKMMAPTWLPPIHTGQALLCPSIHRASGYAPAWLLDHFLIRRRPWAPSKSHSSDFRVNISRQRFTKDFTSWSTVTSTSICISKWNTWKDHTLHYHRLSSLIITILVYPGIIWYLSF